MTTSSSRSSGSGSGSICRRSTRCVPAEMNRVDTISTRSISSAMNGAATAAAMWRASENSGLVGEAGEGLRPISIPR